MVVAIGAVGWTMLPDPEPTADQLNRSVVLRLRDHPQVEFVDLHTGFDLEEMTDDGLHPNAVGSEQIARTWLDALDRTGRRGLPGTQRVMPLGDSITAWSYRDHLAKMLDEQGWNVDMVGSLSDVADPDGGVPDSNDDLDHEGHPGWTTANLLEGNPDEPERGSLDDWISADPDIVLLHIGTNDLFWTADGTEAIAERVERIVNTLTEDEPDRLVMVAEIIPFATELVDIYVGDA